ncbi:glutamine synthetase [Acidianus sulfidivorans JP7]|uniref:Glutamate--ammonia ligase n=1 Tax=Acidianus sulfidivorans JP7 TaxID=619593 RepID=A0A2U9ILU9_9CREN|nr:glutamine synthetase family protein [Acidianus sulfidivorans]AWR96987.1 glutamine synthetase [Acidianus sulfidivorans JP7]
MTIEQTLKDKNVDFVHFVWVGLDGYVRAKTAYIDNANDMIKSGIGLTKAMMSFTPLDTISPYGSFGPQDEDVFLIPDLSSLAIVSSSAFLISYLYEKNKPWIYDAKSSLKRLLDRLDDENKIRVMSSFEIEFYLTKDRKPYDDARCFDPVAFYNNSIISDITKILNLNGIDILRVIKEYGPGQYEYDILFKDAMRSADEVVIFKQVAKYVASKYNVEANFMPKPFNNLAGSGLHLNLSLWKDDKNLFYDPNDSLGLSDLAYNFIGGILEHAKALTAISAPTVNSYKRLIPGSWAPTKITYGYNNKSAMLRIPTSYPNMDSKDKRIEYRVPDPTVNPYLLLVAVIEAGLDGIERGLKPGNPVNENAYYRKDIEDLPRNLREALNELKKDNRLVERIGKEIIDEFIRVKLAEVEALESYVTDLEYDIYRKM